MNKPTYLKLYEFDTYRIIGISSRLQIYDNGSCVSNKYENLQSAEEALKKFVEKTLGLDFSSKIEI